MNTDRAYQSVPLPEDLQKLKNYGDFEGAKKLIASLLERKGPQILPAALRQRLEMESRILDLLDHNEYPHDLAAAQAIMAENIRDYSPEELLQLRQAGRADWIFIDGSLRFQRRFFANLIKTSPEYKRRLITPQANDVSAAERAQLEENIALMKKLGGRSADIRRRAPLRIKKEFERIGKPVLVHLPIPGNGRQIKNFTLLQTSPEHTSIAPADAPQRTISFTTVLQPDQTFSVEYSYTNHVDYVDPDPALAKSLLSNQIDAPEIFPLGEDLPHIRFTPYLKLLLEEIAGGETNPLRRARRIYDFITTRVMYSYMREYAALENISEYAAVNLKGDCGVQAILFITLCRMAGIPARWQSGLGVSEYYTGCHDWAEFYVEPWGWMFCDPSYGGSAWRNGAEERWNYYFCNLDIYRMAANSAILADFVPAKKHPRADPVDNQVGEVEYDDRGLPPYGFETKQELLSFTLK
jgi:transglutaminase-like putative cysteine protease